MSDSRKYKIKEIFGPTIQGEGSFAGMICVFVRFSGCNRWSGLDKDKKESICNFCDTDFFGGDFLSVEEIYKRILEIDGDIKNIVISGGEPTLQIDKNFCEFFFNLGYNLHLETNGSRDINELLKYFKHITLSPKQSIEKTKLKKCDDLKILYPFISEEITLKNFRNFDCKQIYIQPVFGTKTQDLIDHFKNENGIKISFQIHKLLGLK